MIRKLLDNNFRYYTSDGSTLFAPEDGRTVEPDGKYQVIISAVDYDAQAYPGRKDTGTVINEAYLGFTTGKPLLLRKSYADKEVSYARIEAEACLSSFQR